MTIFDSRRTLFEADVGAYFSQALFLIEQLYGQDSTLLGYYNGYAIVIINAINEHLFEEMHRLFLESLGEELAILTSSKIKMNEVREVLLGNSNKIVTGNNNGGLAGFKEMAKKIHGGMYVYPGAMAEISSFSQLIDGKIKKDDEYLYRGFHWLRNSIAHNNSIVDFGTLNASFSAIKDKRYGRPGMTDLDFLKKAIEELKNGFKSLSTDYFGQCNILYHI